VPSSARTPKEDRTRIVRRKNRSATDLLRASPDKTDLRGVVEKTERNGTNRVSRRRKMRKREFGNGTVVAARWGEVHKESSKRTKVGVQRMT